MRQSSITKPERFPSLHLVADPVIKGILEKAEEAHDRASALQTQDGGYIPSRINTRTLAQEVLVNGKWQAIGGGVSPSITVIPPHNHYQSGEGGRLKHSWLEDVLPDQHHAQLHLIGSHSDVSIVSPADGDALLYDTASGTWKNGAGGAGDTFKAMVSADDTTPGYLSSKLTAGPNITLNVLNPGANEVIEIEATGGSTLPQPLDVTDTPQFAGLGLGVAADAARLINGTMTSNLTGTATLSANYISQVFSGSTSGGQTGFNFNTTISGASSGNNSGLLSTLIVSAANTSSNRGTTSTMFLTHTSGTVSDAIGSLSYVNASGNGGSTTNLRCWLLTGNIGAGHTVNVLDCMKIYDFIGTGTITTLAGLNLDKLTRGATNWQIYSAGGNMYFGAGGIATDITTGLVIAKATNQKLAFFGSTPIVQPTFPTITVGAGTAVDTTCRTALRDLLVDLRALGLGA